jgi:hypothetical protein
MLITQAFTPPVDWVPTDSADATTFNGKKTPYDNQWNLMQGFQPRSVSGSATLTWKDCLIYASASAGNSILTLPTSASAPGIRQTIRFKKTDTSFNTITIQAQGADNIINPSSGIATAAGGTLKLGYANNDTFELELVGASWYVNPLVEQDFFAALYVDNNYPASGIQTFTYNTSNYPVLNTIRTGNATNFNTSTRIYTVPITAYYKIRFGTYFATAATAATVYYVISGAPYSAIKRFSSTGEVEDAIETVQLISAGTQLSFILNGYGTSGTRNYYNAYLEINLIKRYYT